VRPIARPPAAEREQLGRDTEARAARLLEASGLILVARNYRCRTGELDLVARGPGILVVAEVRLRTSRAFGGAAASVTWHKQRRIVRATRHLLAHHAELAHLPVRFDVLVADGPAAPLQWIRGAFDAR
jgi:putative endonuclease